MSPLHTVNTYIDIYIKIWSIYVDVSHKFCIRAMVFYFFSFILKLHLDFFFNVVAITINQDQQPHPLSLELWIL